MNLDTAVNSLEQQFILAASDSEGRIEYYYDEDENVLYERFSGRLSMSGIVAYLEGLEGIAFQDGCRVFADISPTSGLQLDLSKLKRVAAASSRVTSRIRKMKVALYAPNRINWGLANCFAFLARQPDYNIQVFSSLPDCQDFLGLPGLASSPNAETQREG